MHASGFWQSRSCSVAHCSLCCTVSMLFVTVCSVLSVGLCNDCRESAAIDTGGWVRNRVSTGAWAWAWACAWAWGRLWTLVRLAASVVCWVNRRSDCSSSSLTLVRWLPSAACLWAAELETAVKQNKLYQLFNTKPSKTMLIVYILFKVLKIPANTVDFQYECSKKRRLPWKKTSSCP